MYILIIFSVTTDMNKNFKKIILITDFVKYRNMLHLSNLRYYYLKYANNSLG